MNFEDFFLAFDDEIAPDTICEKTGAVTISPPHLERSEARKTDDAIIEGRLCLNLLLKTHQICTWCLPLST